MLTLGLFSPSVTIIEQEEEPPSPISGTPLLDNQIYLHDRLNEEGMGKAYPIFNTIIQLESQWRSKAVNKRSGAMGLAQFLPSSWVKYECSGSGLDGRDNIDCMIKAFKLHSIAPWCADYRMHFALKKQGINCKPQWIDERSFEYQ